MMRDSARLMRRERPALLSILVRNRAGEVLKATIRAGDLDAAERVSLLIGDMNLSMVAGCGFSLLMSC